MEISFHPGAEADLNELSAEVENEIRDKILELQQELTSHPDVKLIRIDGRSLFRLKIGERSNKLDHRVIFDISDSTVDVLAVIHRDEGYEAITV